MALVRAELKIPFGRLSEQPGNTPKALHGVSNILAVFGLLLNAIDDCLNETVAVFDGHHYPQGEQFFPAEWKADQLKNILLGRDD
jgi:hypothetical protein